MTTFRCSIAATRRGVAPDAIVREELHEALTETSANVLPLITACA